MLAAQVHPERPRRRCLVITAFPGRQCSGQWQHRPHSAHLVYTHGPVPAHPDWTHQHCALHGIEWTAVCSFGWLRYYWLIYGALGS